VRRGQENSHPASRGFRAEHIEINHIVLPHHLQNPFERNRNEVIIHTDENPGQRSYFRLEPTQEIFAEEESSAMGLHQPPIPFTASL
jgi:hypothetical protein